MSDDADALVVWLSIGTPVLRAARADGKGKREDKSTLFTAPIVQDVGTHAHFDQVRVSPTGQAWSAWAFFAEASGDFAGWYVNFEEPQVRDSRTIYTSDHVLDLWIEPDGTTVRKDEDELDLAVEQTVLDRAKASEIEATCAYVETLVAAHKPPFCDGWERFRPPPEWPTPALPLDGPLLDDAPS